MFTSPCHIEMTMVAHYAGFVFEMIFCLSFDVTSYLNNTNCLLYQIYNSSYLYLVGFPFRFFAEQGNNLCSFPPVVTLRRILIFHGLHFTQVAFFCGVWLLFILRIIATHGKLLFYAGLSLYVEFCCSSPHHIIFGTILVAILHRLLFLLIAIICRCIDTIFSVFSVANYAGYTLISQFPFF